MKKVKSHPKNLKNKLCQPIQSQLKYGKKLENLQSVWSLQKIALRSNRVYIKGSIESARTQQKSPTHFEIKKQDKKDDNNDEEKKTNLIKA